MYQRGENHMIGENLNRIMEEKNINGRELAIEANTSTNTISRIKNDLSDPSASMIKKLAISLECSADNLLFSEEDLDPNQELKMIFKEVEKLDKNKLDIIKEVLRALIMKSKTESISKL